ncbi:hypothetical protein SAMN05444920_12463 [Nonomuraea solani]|uniref:Uncharacterized protein n=1 Tax=Nonomuraea solani TaxID=1144553 RepID=A0A1H6EWA8_9ACTN|nr:hypothetical protein [Nonomuraea solani]SEH02128.1 hypothetical protein SAMN05444920_12463 [Nonomuraea solani]
MAISRRAMLSGLAAAGVWAARPRRAEHVIVVDWDGFDPAYLGRVATPHLDLLAAQGALAIAEGRTVASVQWYMIQDHGVRYGDPEHLYVQPGGGPGHRGRHRAQRGPDR